MEYHTLILTPWMGPHRIVPWTKAMGKLINGRIEILEAYDEVIKSPSKTYQIPSVARIITKIPYHKKGVKFSRTNVFTRDNHTCQYCLRKFAKRQLNYDHVVPRRQGGKTVWENIVTSCYPCNSRKAGRTPEQAGMRLLSTPRKPDHLPLTEAAFPVAKAPEEWLFYLGENKDFLQG